MRVKPIYAWRAFWLIVGVIELSGLPDNLSTWRGWIGHMGEVLSTNGARWCVLLVVAAMVAAPSAIDWVRRRRLRALATKDGDKIFRSVQVVSMELRCEIGMYEPNKGKCIWSLRSVLFLTPNKPVTLPLHDFHAAFMAKSASSVKPKSGLSIWLYQITAWRNDPAYPGSGQFQAKFDGPGRLYVDCENVGLIDPLILTEDLANVVRMVLRVGIAEHPQRSVEMRLPLYRRSPSEPVWIARPSRIRPLRVIKPETQG
jgi:hypothetical protein